MSDEQTKKTDTTGDQVVKPVETDKKDLTPREQLKADNDAFEKELIRGRELKKEGQELEAQKMLGGTTGGHVETEPAKETPAEYAKRIMKGGQ